MIPFTRITRREKSGIQWASNTLRGIMTPANVFPIFDKIKIYRRVGATIILLHLVLTTGGRGSNGCLSCCDISAHRCLCPDTDNHPILRSLLTDTDNPLLSLVLLLTSPLSSFFYIFHTAVSHPRWHWHTFSLSELSQLFTTFHNFSQLSQLFELFPMLLLGRLRTPLWK